MAIVKDGAYHGPLGNLVYRTIRGVNIVQSKPDHQNQSIATKKASHEFGLCSNTACTLRNVLLGIFNWSDGQMGTRLVTAVRRAFLESESGMVNQRDLHDGNLGCLVGFQFNNNSPLQSVLRVRPEVSVTEEGLLRMRLPAFTPKRDMVFPRSALSIKSSVRVTLLAFNLRDDYYGVLEVREADVNAKGMDEICWDFDHTIADGCAVLMFMSLQYYTEDALNGRRYMNGQNLNPVELIGAYQYWQGRTSECPSYESPVSNPLPGYKGNDMLRDYLVKYN